MKIKRTITTFDDFKVGDLVEHAIFGEGKIMSLSYANMSQIKKPCTWDETIFKQLWLFLRVNETLVLLVSFPNAGFL